MKRFFGLIGLAILAIVLAGCPSNAPAPTPPPTPTPPVDWTIDANWQFQFTNFPPCSGTVTKSCVSGFSWGFIESGVQLAPVKTTAIASFAACPATLPSPPDLTCQQPANSQGFTTLVDVGNSLLPVGGTGATIYVIVNGFDQNGVAAQSPAATGNTVTLALQGAVNPQFSNH